MAITVQAGTGASVASPAVSITPALPADVISGDLLLVAFTAQIVLTSVACSGYTQVEHRDGAADSGDDWYLFKKTAGSSESAPTVTWTGGAAAVAMVIRIRGWDPAGGPAQLTTQVSATTTASIDPPTAGSVKIAVVHTDPSTAGSITWTGGATSLGEIANAAAAYISAAYKLEDTAGALTYTWSGTGSVAALILSIAPAATSTIARFKRLKLGTGLSGSDLGGGSIQLANSAPVPVGGSAGQVLTKTSGTDYDTGWQTPVDATPWIVDIDVFHTPANQVNWNTVGVGDASTIYQGWRLSSVQNAEVSWDVLLGAGSWVLEVIFVQGPDRGTLTVLLDSVAVPGTPIGYDPAVVYNSRSAIPAFAVAATGKHRVTLRVATKHASSTGYLCLLQHVQLRRIT